MSTAFILIVVFSQTGYNNSSMTSVVQEFNTQQACVTALKEVSSSLTGPNARIISQGCYKK